MATLKCPKCGYELTGSEEQLKEFNEAVNKEVKEREKILKDAIESKAKTSNEKAISELNEKIARLEATLQSKDKEIKAAVSEEASKKDKIVSELKHQLELAESNKQLAISNSVKLKDDEIIGLKHQIEMNDEKSKNKLKEELSRQAQAKDDEIATLRRQLDIATDYKTRMNVKDLGEDLEQYCVNKFNAIRSNTYPNAYFEKDSDTKVNGEKGDFVFRDYIVDGDKKIEYISIMFDMKNENDATKKKQKNEESFKKLDSDRRAKGCEYAVLVSMREQGNPMYDQGITDVSYAYSKMYVVRPDQFLNIIALLRGAALNNVKDKLALANYQMRNFDVTNFENEWVKWKADWGDNIGKARKHFEDTIKAIDASIKNMQNIRDALTGTIKQLGYADNKVQDLTLRKLAKNSPSIKEQLKNK